jgi:hypothetical protein
LILLDTSVLSDSRGSTDAGVVLCSGLAGGGGAGAALGATFASGKGDLWLTRDGETGPNTVIVFW